MSPVLRQTSIRLDKASQQLFHRPSNGALPDVSPCITSSWAQIPTDILAPAGGPDGPEVEKRSSAITGSFRGRRASTAASEDGGRTCPVAASTGSMTMRASDGAIGLPSISVKTSGPPKRSSSNGEVTHVSPKVAPRALSEMPAAGKPPRPPAPKKSSTDLEISSATNCNVDVIRTPSRSGAQPPALVRQSNYSMILSFERPSAVSEVIKKAIASKYEVAYNMTGETGSCMYMSPEVQRHEPYNAKTDVYSFGVMLYEVFARTMLVTTADAIDPGRAAGEVGAMGHAGSSPI